MKLKTSFFNPTLYRKNLTRFWPLWGLTSFFGALIPISGIMMCLNGDLKTTALEFKEVYYNAIVYFAPVVLLCYCILCAMAVWSYLYNARSVGMMHTLPISREGLFVTNFLSGLTMVAIPWAVTALFCVILSIVARSFSAWPLFVTILCIAGEGLFYFSSATAAAFVTGNIFALPALYFLFHFLAPLLDTLITQFSANMIFGLQSRAYTGVVNWLSPTVYIMGNVDVRNLYTERPIPGQPNVTESVLASVTLEKGWLIAVYALVGLALLGVAYVLYRYRKSESAGEVIAMSWGRPVFRYGIAALAALGGGQLLYIIIFNSFDLDQDPYRILPLIFCMLIAGLIGYYGASMLLAKTLRVFKGSQRGAAIVAAGCVIACCVVGFDMLGVAKRVPSADSVKYVRLYAANNTYYLFPGEDADVLEELRDTHKAIIAEKDYAQKMMNARTIKMMDATPIEDSGDFEKSTYVTFRVNYFLKNGLNVDRNYFLYLTKDRMEEPGTYDNALDRFINSTEMKLRRLRFDDPRFIIENGNIEIQKRDDGFEFSSRELSEVLAAIADDAKAGAWGQYDWFDEDNTTYAVSMFFWYSINDVEELASRGMDNITVYLRPGMTNTINCLKKMGYLTDDDLITSAEMRKIWEERDGMKYPPDMAGVELDAATLEPIDSPSEAIPPEAESVTPETAPEAESVTPETAPEGETVTPQPAPVTEPVTNPDALNNPNSAPQTPAESSIASAQSVISAVEDELQADGTSVEETLAKQRDEYREQADKAETEEERKQLMELADSIEVMLQDYQNYSAMEAENSASSMGS